MGLKSCDYSSPRRRRLLSPDADFRSTWQSSGGSLQEAAAIAARSRSDGSGGRAGGGSAGLRGGNRGGGRRSPRPERGSLERCSAPSPPRSAPLRAPPPAAAGAGRRGAHAVTPSGSAALGGSRGGRATPLQQPLVPEGRREALARPLPPGMGPRRG